VSMSRKQAGNIRRMSAARAPGRAWEVK